jgi:hypothetical protein
MSRANGSK